jgi:HlyD family secretion protein
MKKNAACASLLALVSSLNTVSCGRAQALPESAYQGVVELDERVLGFELGGRVDALLTTRGAQVQAGQRLATLDSELEATLRLARESDANAARAQVALLKAGSRAEDIRSMDAQTRAARASEDLLVKSLAREKALFARNASTEAAVEDLEGRLERAVAERQSFEQRLALLRRGSRSEDVTAAEARAASAVAAVKLEEERLERHVLVAPVEGLVLETHVKTGEIVGAGAPVVTLGEAKRPYADVFVPQGKLPGLRMGVRAEVRVDGEPSAFPGVIETIAQKTEFTPRYLFSERERPNLVVRVRVRIDDPGERLHAGVPTFVTFAAGPGNAP